MTQEKKGHVLCVDDEPVLLRSLTWLLEPEFHVKTARGGEEGLRVVEDNDFDVIISDQRMPGMTGAEFLAQAKVMSPRAMRLLLTGYSDMEALVSSVNDGEIWRFIQKPWNKEELRDLVETAAQVAKESDGASFETPVEIADASNVLVVGQDEELHLAIEENPDAYTRISHAYSLSQAAQMLSEERIGAIVSEVKNGSDDVIRFIALLKQKRPDIVSVVVADETDLKQLVRLINDG